MGKVCTILRSETLHTHPGMQCTLLCKFYRKMTHEYYVNT